MTESQRRELEFFGVVIPKEEPVRPAPQMGGWKPKHPGEEPPF